MPMSPYKKLGLGEVKPTRMILQLADHSQKAPLGVLKDVLVKVDKFILSLILLFLAWMMIKKYQLS